MVHPRLSILPSGTSSAAQDQDQFLRDPIVLRKTKLRSSGTELSRSRAETRRSGLRLVSPGQIQLAAEGWTIGFSPGAMVEHHRRNSLRAYWR